MRLHWEHPVLRTDEDSERKATWLELFYDLVFVAVVAELAHTFSEHISWDGAGQFILLFIPVWWLWISGTYYNDRFELDDISHRLLTFSQMIPVAALAIFVHDAFGETSQKFALSYAAARLVINFLWIRGGYHNPIARPVTNRYVTGFSISILLWVMSVFVPPPWRFGFWGLGLAFDLLTPLATLQIQASRLPRLSRSHLPERYGLFTILVLGKTVISAIAGITEAEEFTFTQGLIGFLGLIIAIGIWWIYFDQIADHPPHRTVWSTAGWGYLHLPLVVAITAMGVGVLNVVADHPTELTASASWLLAFGVAAALLAIGGIELLQAGQHSIWDRVFRFGGALAVLGLGFAGPSIGSLTFNILLVAIVIAQIVQGIFVLSPTDEAITAERTSAPSAHD